MPTGRCTSIVIGLVIMAVIVTCPGAAQTKRAVLIGINTYQPAGIPQKGPAIVEGTTKASVGRGSWTNLDGALNDVESFRQVLISRYGFKLENITVLKESAATRDNILKTVEERLLSAAKPNDLSIFYYAGHGSQVANSKSKETDKKDETIVPADSYLGVPDIRDKEIRRLFHRIVEKGIVLTAIFDSCHSGSITRGLGNQTEKLRMLQMDPRDAADGEEAPVPEQEGALIFSAALDTQGAAESSDSEGTAHGAFTLALTEVLRSAPPTETAENIMRSLRARFLAENRTQTPVMAGRAERIKGPLFGGSGIQQSQTTLAVTANEEGAVKLDGGLPLGLGAGSELQKIKIKDSDDPNTKLEITEVSLSASTAKVIAGDAAKVQPGDLFFVTRWAYRSGSNLHVWVAPATPRDRVEAIAGEARKLRTNPTLRWVDDPTENTPTHIAFYDGTNWVLAGPSATDTLGSSWSTPKLLSALSKAGGKPRLFVIMPPSTELKATLKFADDPRSAVQPAKSPAAADYMLVGRVTDTAVEYAWVLPTIVPRQSPQADSGAGSETASAPIFSLPVRSSWFAGVGADETKKAAAELMDRALRAARVHAWLTLNAPSEGTGAFPYRLYLQNTRTGELISDGVTRGGESYRMILKAEPADPKEMAAIRPKRIYIFAINQWGKSSLLFPPPNEDSIENQLPVLVDNRWPDQIVVGGSDYTFEVGAPFGADTYFMLATNERIDPRGLEFDGVGGEVRRGAAASELDNLLSGIGAPTRDAAIKKVRGNWLLQRVITKSVPAATGSK